MGKDVLLTVNNVQKVSHRNVSDLMEERLNSAPNRSLSNIATLR